MATVSNANFISFIKSYGPWADNKMQFEEHVRKTSQLHNISALEYPSAYRSCIPLVKEVIHTSKSHIILVCGRAGDGKTHLLGQLFEKDDLLNLGRDNFQKVLSTKNSLQNFTLETGLNLTVVCDLSQIPEKSDDEKLLCNNILHTIKVQNASVQVEQDPKLILIAGNNGKILEKLTTLLKELNGFISAHNDIDEQEQREFLQLNWIIAEYKQVQVKIKEILYQLKHLFIENQVVNIPSFTLIDMSNRVDDTVLQEMFDVLLKHDCWNKCQECSCVNQCPILRNRMILSYPWLQERLKNVLHLLKADGFHLTIRTVQSLLVNALLGRGFNSDARSSDLTCLKIKHNVEANEGTCTFESNVYDNLLGFNFKQNARIERDIFKALSQLQLGMHTSKQIDNFLLHEETNQLSSLESNICKTFINSFDLFGCHEALISSWNNLKRLTIEKVKNNSDEMTEAKENFSKNIQALRRILFFNLGAPFDLVDSTNRVDLSNASYLKQLPSDTDSCKQTDKVYDHSEDLFFDPYLLTCYPHARDYLEIERLTFNNSIEEIKNNHAAQMLILALNRIFTGLYTTQDTENLYVPANHINNQSIIYNENIFKFKAYTYNIERSINLVRLTEYNLPVLQFVDIAHKDQSSQRSHANLILTPYMFECLMQVADGVSSLCLPKQAIHEIKVFKNKIFSILEQQISTVFDTSNTHTLLSAIRRIEVEDGGSIVSRKQMNIG